MLKLRIFCYALALSIILPLSISAAPLELNFQTAVTPTFPTREYIFNWANSFEKVTNGEVKVKSYFLNDLVSSRTVLENTINGMVDMGCWSVSMFENRVPNVQVTSVPAITTSLGHAIEVMWGLYEKSPEIKKELDSAGVLLLITPTTRAMFFSMSTPIYSPDDIKGKRVLVHSANNGEEVKAWGGTPIFITPSDTYIGLQRGMGDMIFTGDGIAKALNLQEICKSATLFSTGNSFQITSINKDIAKEISPENLKAIQAISGKEVSMDIARILNEDYMKTVQLFKNAGVQIIELTPEQEEAFIKGEESLIKDFWPNHLKKLGVKDPQQLIKLTEEIANTVTDPF